MMKHGVSHTAVALMAVVSGEVLSRKFLLYWPKFEQQLSLYLLPFLHRHDVDIEPGRLATLVTIGLFAFLWGVTFKHLGG